MNCWILQCNINHFDWIEYMKKHKSKPDTWGINPKRNKKVIGKIKADDIAFIWLTQDKGKETRGIYAMGRITKSPNKNIRPFPYAKPFWRKTKTAKEAEERRMKLLNLELQYIDRPIIENYIQKGELEAVGLGGLLVIKRPRGTSICEVPQGCESIRKMLETRQGR